MHQSGRWKFEIMCLYSSNLLSKILMNYDCHKTLTTMTIIYATTDNCQSEL